MILKRLNFLHVLGLLLIVWGVADFYNYIMVGKDTLNQYIGTGNEIVIKQLVNATLQNGIFKTIGGCGIIIAAFRTKRR